MKIIVIHRNTRHVRRSWRAAIRLIRRTDRIRIRPGVFAVTAYVTIER